MSVLHSLLGILIALSVRYALENVSMEVESPQKRLKRPIVVFPVCSKGMFPTCTNLLASQLGTDNYLRKRASLPRFLNNFNRLVLKCNKSWYIKARHLFISDRCVN